MDPHQKQIVIGSVSGILALSLVITVVVVVVLYKKGRFDQRINQMKVKLYKNYIYKIKCERPGVISFTKGLLFDRSGAVINDKTTFTSTQSSMYWPNGQAANYFKLPPPTGESATHAWGNEWFEIVLKPPLTIAKMTLDQSVGWYNRSDQLKCTAYNVDDTIAFTGINTVTGAVTTYKFIA